LSLATPEHDDQSRFKLNSVQVSKGPAVVTVTGDSAAQKRLNHLIALKSRSVDTNSQSPPWLLGAASYVPSKFSLLASSAIRANAVNSSVTTRTSSQGAANQTSRINTKSISAAASAQVATVALTMGYARMLARRQGLTVANAMATNAADPCILWKRWALDDVFAITISSQLVFNANPARLGMGSVLATARDIAEKELAFSLISERFGTDSVVLGTICSAIVSPARSCCDPVWSSFVLVVYLLSHTEGRAILRETALTDVDFQTAVAFEAYGRAEITRRARLEQQQAAQKAAAGAAPAPPSRLTLKRKRGGKGNCGNSVNDSSGLLLWWHESLRCENAAVLMSLVAYSRSAAKAAADATLRKQAGPSVAHENSLIRDLSAQNAEKSAERLADEFVGGRRERMPKLLRWKLEDEEFVGHTRTIGDALNTRIHVCEMAPPLVQPSCDIKLAWSIASAHFSPSGNQDSSLPGVLERLHESQKVAGLGGKRNELQASRIETGALSQVDVPLTTDLSGITRSTISMAMRMRLTDSQMRSAHNLHAELMQATPAAATAAAEGGFPTLQSASSADGRIEPLCTPASKLAYGIYMNEEVRTWLGSKTRKNDPCRVVFGQVTPQELSRDVAPVVNVEPPPLLAIVDFGVEVLAPANGTHADVGVALHVCGESATRVPEVLEALRTSLPPDEFQQQAIAMVWAATSQATYLSNVSTCISAAHANSAISSSKKISVADIHRLSFLSAFDVYAAGVCNLEPNLLGTAYSGTYGACFDTGISPPGLMGYNHRSDKRQHGVNRCLEPPPMQI
jgi:hypothetical protein